MKDLNSIIIEGIVRWIYPTESGYVPCFSFELENEYGRFICGPDMNRKVLTPEADDKVRIVGRVENKEGLFRIIAEHIEIRVRLKR